MTSVELLPCPFCSGAATIVATGVTTSLWAKCLGCGATTSLEGTTVEAAAAAWNRRALIQPTPAETEPVAWQKRWIGGAALGDWELCTSAASVESFRAANSSRYEYRPLYASPTPPPIGDGEGDLVAGQQAELERRIYLAETNRDDWRERAESAEAQVSTLSRQLEEAREALTAADDARTRLNNYADAANSGQAQAGGRELKRKIWGAFSDYDRIRAKETVSHG